MRHSGIRQLAEMGLRMKIMKFGGTSVGQPQRMHHVANLITADKEEKIVVLSAVSGTTNTLIDISLHLIAQQARYG